MTLRFLNTYSKKLEPFAPVAPPAVRLYTCGPTVHDFAHIGNFRTYVFEDVLRRWLRYRGFQVTQVMNITDVEDKIIAKAAAAGVKIGDWTGRYTQDFFEDCATLRIEPAEHYPRATEYVPEMVTLVQELERRGHTYESEGSIYFRIASFPEYGRLSGIDLTQLRPGARVDVDEYDKDDPRDFVLWKAAKEGEPSWPSPWGPGRPGWHIECSAMSMKLLGEELDIHTGGADNVFPHHENEIAQSVAATGKPFARLWLHSEWLLVGGEKMSKSKGNFYTVRDLLAKGIEALAIRMLYVQHHYRRQINFTMDSIGAAAAALETLRTLQTRLYAYFGDGPDGVTALVAEARKEFERAMDEDLATPEALAALFGFARQVNPILERGELSLEGKARSLELLAGVDTVLGVLERRTAKLPDELAAKVVARAAARTARDFVASDRLRDELRGAGVTIEDTKHGQRVFLQGIPVEGLS